MSEDKLHIVGGETLKKNGHVDTLIKELLHNAPVEFVAVTIQTSAHSARKWMEESRE